MAEALPQALSWLDAKKHQAMADIAQAMQAPETVGPNIWAAIKDLSSMTGRLEDTGDPEQNSRNAMSNLAMMGTMGGPKARTADLVKLEVAKKWEKNGAPREVIRDKTGWFKGTDGNWRFEIPDTRATVNTTAFDASAPQKANNYLPLENQPLTDFMVHPELAEAYPHLLAKAVLNIAKRPDWMPQENSGSFKVSGGIPNIMVRSKTPEGVKSTLLHELQHGVQEIEGFAPGGSASVSVQGSNLSPFDIYQRLAGEAEARLVPKRSSMTPQQLKTVHPWDMFDIPEALQVIRPSDVLKYK